jgi:hypothetical protein
MLANLSHLKFKLSIDKAKLLEKNFTDYSNFPEQKTTSLLPKFKSVGEIDTSQLFSYQVFPKTILDFKSQWEEEKRGMKTGDVIVQRIFMPPLGHGVCLEFAVKIKQIVLEKHKVGFSYETLKGHPESGVSEFYFEETNGKVSFNIHTFSCPSHWSSRITKNLFTLPYQKWCTNKAIKNVVLNTNAAPK